MSLVVLLYHQSGRRTIAVLLQFWSRFFFCQWTWTGLNTINDEWNCVISITDYTFTTCVVAFCCLVVISQVWAGLSTTAFCCLVFSSKIRAVITIQARGRVCTRTVPCTVSNPTSYRTLGPRTPVRVATICCQNWESKQLTINID